MAIYKYHICDVPDLGELFQMINEENSEIVEMLYASDSQQVITVTKEGKKGFIQTMKEKAESEPEEEE